MFNLDYLTNRIQTLQSRRDRIKALLEEMHVEIPERKTEELQFSYTLAASTLKNLKIACVMDRFTLDSYAPECQLFEVTPEHWREEIESFQPDLLFIESAWKGKDDSWYRKIANGSKEYFEMTSYCQEKDIPIVFWNKEDPVYTDTFMPAARMADFVFTTDIDCIQKYKETLQHDRVYFLHFAAQPQIHNPIEKYERKDKFCFAGAYYHKYKKRAEVFDNFSKIFIETKGFDIYDRNYKSALPEHAFPKTYDSYILGKLDSSEIDIAYKGYNYGVNMNSVNQSQTMFARRVFEMLASNTVTIGNYARGLKNVFGDLTVCTDDAKELERCLATYCKDDITFRKYRLAGLRKVLTEGLYEDRLDYIVQKVFQKSIKKQLPKIILFADVRNDEEARLLSLLRKQTYPHTELYLIGKTGKDTEQIHFLSEEQATNILLNCWDSNSYLGVWDSHDYYGPNYLYDLVYTLRYGLFSGIGKSTYYCYNKEQFMLTEEEKEYTVCSKLAPRRAIIKGSSAQLQRKTVLEFLNLQSIEDTNFLSIDRFNYCEAFGQEVCMFVDDLKIPDTGISLAEIENIAESIVVNHQLEQGTRLTGDKLFELIKVKEFPAVVVSLDQKEIHLNSLLADEQNQYIYIEKLYTVADGLIGTKFHVLFDGMGSTEVLGVCIFYDEKKNKLSPVFPRSGVLEMFEIPNTAAYVKFGLRIRGTGEYRFKKIALGIEHNPNERAVFLSRSNVLVLSNQYPSYENLYRNMFVHKRVQSYKNDGYVYDVMRMNIYSKNLFGEFEGINIIEGQSESLISVLEHSKIDTVCVHFLDQQMWEVLKKFKKRLRILVWIHGAEIHPWWRRTFNYRNVAEEESAKRASAVREVFWAQVFKDRAEMNIHFIFVSRFFADEVFEDYKITLGKEEYSVIHNIVDTETFCYCKKNVEQRKHLLSIRPYATRIYANDLTVKCILALSKKEFFKELSITLIGSGELFEETIKPLRKFSNVTIINKFLRQDEIAAYHKDFGIFLVPTRYDSQGVSRDEAMSSGLVPVTNAVAAIPEFVDETCGILVPGEDYLGMAQGIESLFYDPAKFEKLSRNAARRVQKQSSKNATIVAEETLINT